MKDCLELKITYLNVELLEELGLVPSRNRYSLNRFINKDLRKDSNENNKK